MKPEKMMTPTAIQVGLRMRATLSISAASSTDDASSAPAFLTCAADNSINFLLQHALASEQHPPLEILAAFWPSWRVQHRRQTFSRQKQTASEHANQSQP